MRSISREVVIDPSETTRRPHHKEEHYLDKVTIAYLQGALGDATYSRLHKTHRISQSHIEWLKRLKSLLESLGYKSWIYKEGRQRGVYILETTSKILSLNFDPDLLESPDEKKAYIRGYFDAEGGTSRGGRVRFYLQFAEKHKKRLKKVRNLLEQLGINCGRIHNPSYRQDPNYWRFYVKSCSYKKFIEEIGSWHPEKQRFLFKWVKK